MNNVQKIITSLFIFTVLIGITVLCGWYFNIQILKSILPGFITMKGNTAVGLICLAAAAFLFTLKNSKMAKWFGIFISFAVMIFALLTLSEYLFGFDFKIDEFLFLDPDAMKTRWPPGRFAPITGVNFIFISAALILNSFDSKRFSKITQGLVIIAWIASLQALVGYVSGNTYTFGSAFYTQIALHTAILFSMLTTGILLSFRHEGFLKHLTGEGVAGKVGRKLLLAAIIVPPLINIGVLHLINNNVIDSDFGILVRVMGMVVCFAWMAMETSKYLSDVDDKRAEAVQAQLMRTEELQRALHARDDLLSICSHELRTPISSMKLQTQFVKYQMEKDDPNALSPKKMADIIEQSDRQLDRLTKLIEDMLDFSRINSGRFSLAKEEFDLHQLVVGLLENFKIQLKANQCELTLSVESNKPILVFWDSYRIEQLIGNLITNAIKYGSRKPIIVKLVQDEMNTGIQVTDQGMGIVPNDIERIFQPYERAISVSKISGLGLGLFISRKIAEAHGGTIKVESLAGVGSTFTAMIPTRMEDVHEEGLSYAI